MRKGMLAVLVVFCFTLAPVVADSFCNTTDCRYGTTIDDFEAGTIGTLPANWVKGGADRGCTCSPLLLAELTTQASPAGVNGAKSGRLGTYCCDVMWANRTYTNAASNKVGVLFQITGYWSTQTGCSLFAPAYGPYVRVRVVNNLGATLASCNVVWTVTEGTYGTTGYSLNLTTQGLNGYPLTKGAWYFAECTGNFLGTNGYIMIDQGSTSGCVASYTYIDAIYFDTTCGGVMCSAGQLCCNDVCTDQSDSNCGACGKACNAGQTCSSATCVCDATHSNCDANLANGCETLTSGIQNGNCNTGTLACNTGYANCDANLANGCETTLGTTTNCASCGNACTGGRICTASTCQCPTGTTLCGTTCVNTQTDNNNCGACGSVCGTTGSYTTATCSAGQCTCTTGYARCTGDGSTSTACKTNTQTSNINCGTCGNACTGGKTCQAGVCTCPAGTTLCGATCVDALTDPNNCGACENPCPSGIACVGGVCQCPTGTQVCNRECVSTQTDPLNCGTCATVCGLGYTCVSGACKTSCTAATDCASGYVCILDEAPLGHCYTGCSSVLNGKEVVGSGGQQCCGATPISGYQCLPSLIPENNCDLNNQGYCTAGCTYDKSSASAYCTSTCMVGNELMHCSDGVNNCDETGVDSGGSCSTHCSPASACNTQARYYCSAENEKDFTAYCDEANNCEHCGDGLVNCEEACDETSEGYVGNCDFSTFTYCSACTASKTYTPTDLFCTQCAAVSSAADGDADARYCSCKSGAWLNGGGDKNCCGDDGTTEAWAFETDQIRLCVNGASRKCEGQNEILPVDGTNYYCTKSGVLWVWGTDPCVSGDGNCYDATACGTIDEECKKGQGEACESTPQCKNTLACVDEAMDDVRVCCPEGTCAYNRQCVLEGAYGSYGCKAGSWYSCDATTACMQDESLMCSSSTNEWVPIPEYLGADAHGCDDSCTVGSRCPSNGACMLAQGESCSGNEQFCCDGQCSSGHCCPDESVWCTDACRTIIDISQPHDCTGCEALCPSGYACSSGLCMPTQSCEATSCPFGLACARDTAAENPTCCPTGTCWDLQANKCVASNTLDSTSQYACSNGQWVEYCSLTASNTNYKRECDSSCEADDACHGKSPATDYANYACTSSCASTNATASIFIEARRCNSTLLTDCLQEAGTTDLSIEEGMAVPVNFSVDYPDGVPRESNMTILLDGAVYNKTTGTGGTFLLQGLAPGEHVVNVTADHPDFLSNTTSARIWVEPDLESAILIATKPAKIAMEIGKPVDINVTLANKGKTNYTFAVATSLDARHASSVVAEGGRTTTLAMQILSPTQLGEVPFNITFTAPEGAVLYKAVITVFPEVKHEISLASSVSNGLYALQIENTGTVQEILRVAGCGKNETLVVASGETESLELGALSGSCTICGENSLVKKCKVVEPVQFSLSVPPTVAARVGEAGSILFKTTASKTGSITVRSNSDLFPEFSCQATCEQELSFLPSKVGQTSVTFTAVWPQYGMEAVGTTQIIVSQVFETANDQQALETSIADIGARIQKLEDAGIRVDAIKGIYDAVKLIDTSSPQGVAQAVSELERAKKYLRYAEDTGVPEAREFPLLQAIAGVVAVAVAAGLLYTVMPKHPAHPDVPHSEVHHDQPAQAAAAKTVKGPDGKTYTIPPGGQLVRLPNGQITVVPAGMTVGRTPDGRYQLVRKTA